MNQIDQEKNVCGVWPLLYFEAGGTKDRYDFDLGLSIIRASEDIIHSIIEAFERWESYDPLNYYEQGSSLRWSLPGSVQWLLVAQTPTLIQEIPYRDIGIHFGEIIEKDLVDTFIAGLKIVKSTPALVPVRLKAEIDVKDGSINKIEEIDDSHIGDYEHPRTYWPKGLPEEFKEEDFAILQLVWDGLVTLYHLKDWIEFVFSERFAAQIDRIADQVTHNGISVDSLKLLESILGEEVFLSKLTNDDNVILSGLTKIIDSGSAFLKVEEDNEKERQERYRCNLAHVFWEKRREWFAATTRLGRAVQIFNEGQHLSPIHAFLAMCMVLETLYCTDSQEIAHRISVRLAKLLGTDYTERKKRYECMKKIYNERSKVIHGEKPFDKVPGSVRKSAFWLARESLQRILCNEKLLIMFSESEKKSIDEIREFFLSLELK